MNNQEVFNRTWHHHVTNAQPLGFDDESGLCTYWSNEGGVIRRCSIGAALPDEIAKRLRNLQVGVQDLVDDLPEVAKRFDHCNIDFLTELQETHDYEARRQREASEGRIDEDLGPPRGIEACYRKLAASWRLTIPNEGGTANAGPRATL